MLPLPSLLTGILIVVTIALAILTLFIAAITIRCTCVVALSTLSCQPPPVFVAPVAG
jgi:hypothetical protein